MTTNASPDPPPQLKSIQSYLKIASDIERIDPVVSHWVRLFSIETALKIDKNSPECKSFIISVMSQMEEFKKMQKGNEAVFNEVVGQAHFENFVVALFTKVDTLDRNGTANKNTVRMFYMAAILFEAMAVFGPLSEEITQRAKYAKFKAAYIQKCLKLGQVPKPGPIEGTDLEDPSNLTQDDAAPSATLPDKQPTQGQDANKARDANENKPEPYIMTPKSIPQPLNPTHSQEPPSSSSFKVEPTDNSDRNTTTTSGGASTIDNIKFHALNGAPLNADDLIKSQKYCKFAGSALQYDDIPTAVKNLEKALKLLTTGNSD